jgi:hypothetical protein
MTIAQSLTPSDSLLLSTCANTDPWYLVIPNHMNNLAIYMPRNDFLALYSLISAIYMRNFPLYTEFKYPGKVSIARRLTVSVTETKVKKRIEVNHIFGILKKYGGDLSTTDYQ